MKKSLLALAVLGSFAGVAAAQSSVTLYGTLDVSLTRQTGVKWTAFGVNGGSYHTPSRFGLKGSEDLGGGNAAIFDLQTGGLGMGNGTFGGTGGLTFTREAYVGLSNAAIGKVKAGLDASVATYAFAGINLNDISSSDAPAAVGLDPVTWYGSSRRKGFVSYTTNNIAGFDAQVGYTLKHTSELLGDEKAATQVRANYTIGGLTAGLAAETGHKAANRTAWALGAKYDAPMFAVNAGLVRSETATVTAGVASATNGAPSDQGGKGFFVGGMAKFGAAAVGTQIASNSTSHNKAYELFANYALSKRSKLYADFLDKKVDATNTTVKSLGMGLTHNF